MQPWEQGPPADHPAFALTNEALSPGRREDPEAGCPSSRCTPREAIPWKELEPWDAWEMFLTHVREENGVLGGLLADLGLVALAGGEQGGKIELAAPATGIARTALRENPELRAAFEELSIAYFGESMHLELHDFIASLPETPSLALVEAERDRLHVQSIEEAARTHPRIMTLLRTFDGSLQSIEPLEGPTLPPPGQRGLP